MNALQEKSAVRLILASKSPRRAALLAQVGFSIEIHSSDVDERSFAENDPIRHVTRLARMKTEQVARAYGEAVIIGADTVVVLDGRILGKPESPDEAVEMLNGLNGRVHDVYTGIALIQKPTDRLVMAFERTGVHFSHLDRREIEDYVASGEPMDKAGAYGIQGRAALFVDRIDGCYFNVVGFPLSKFSRCLKTLLYGEKRESVFWDGGELKR
ncbi:septum formation inhibitor Maf [candidate division KSB1 bacterium]|nr:septum formation inhibitor Maf [candidate division KSB1 bacterium]